MSLELIEVAGSINLLPVNEILIEDQNPPAEPLNVRISQIEEESNFTITPINKTRFDGSQVTLRYRFSKKLYIPHNMYSTNGLIQALDHFLGRGTVSDQGDSNHIHCTLKLGGDGTINNTGALDIMLCNYGNVLNLSYEIESVELRPRLILTIDFITTNLYSIFSTP